MSASITGARSPSAMNMLFSVNCTPAGSIRDSGITVETVSAVPLPSMESTIARIRSSCEGGA